MSWLNVDDGMGEHPKAFAAGHAALGLWLVLACYAARRLTDGFIPGPLAEREAQGDELTALVAAGLVDVVEGGYQLHDYLDWNKSREKVEAEKAAARARQAAWAAKKQQRDNASPNASADGSLTLPTPLHSTPPLKGEGRSARPKKGGARSPNNNVTPIKPAMCEIHHQQIPCLGCAADMKAGNQ